MPKSAKIQHDEAPDLSTVAEQDSLKDEFFRRLCAKLVESLDVDGLAAQVAEKLAPMLFSTMRVDRLADVVVASHGAELAEQLAQELAKRIAQ